MGFVPHDSGLFFLNPGSQEQQSALNWGGTREPTHCARPTSLAEHGLRLLEGQIQSAKPTRMQTSSSVKALNSMHVKSAIRENEDRNRFCAKTCLKNKRIKEKRAVVARSARSIGTFPRLECLAPSLQALMSRCGSKVWGSAGTKSWDMVRKIWSISYGPYHTVWS